MHNQQFLIFDTTDMWLTMHLLRKVIDVILQQSCQSTAYFFQISFDWFCSQFTNVWAEKFYWLFGLFIVYICALVTLHMTGVHTAQYSVEGFFFKLIVLYMWYHLNKPETGSFIDDKMILKKLSLSASLLNNESPHLQIILIVCLFFKSHHAQTIQLLPC